MKNKILLTVASLAIVLSYSAVSSHSDEKNSPKTFVVAPAESNGDIMIAAPLANHYKTDLIITKKNKVDFSKISKYNDTIILVGGENTIKSEVFSGYQIRRISGSDRYDTSLKMLDFRKNIGTVNSVNIVSGSKLADAISVAASDVPVVLTPTIHPTKDKFKNVIQNIKNATAGYDKTALGGTTSISEKVLKALGAKRINGSSRYETSELYEKTLGRETFIESYDSNDDIGNFRLANKAYLENKGFLIKRIKLEYKGKIVTQEYSPNTTTDLRDLLYNLKYQKASDKVVNLKFDTNIFVDGNKYEVNLKNIMSNSSEIHIKLMDNKYIALKRTNPLATDFKNIIYNMLRESSFDFKQIS